MLRLNDRHLFVICGGPDTGRYEVAAMLAGGAAFLSLHDEMKSDSGTPTQHITVQSFALEDFFLQSKGGKRFYKFPEDSRVGKDAWVDAEADLVRRTSVAMTAGIRCIIVHMSFFLDGIGNLAETHGYQITNLATQDMRTQVAEARRVARFGEGGFAGEYRDWPHHKLTDRKAFGNVYHNGDAPLEVAKPEPKAAQDVHRMRVVGVRSNVAESQLLPFQRLLGQVFGKSLRVAPREVRSLFLEGSELTIPLDLYLNLSAAKASLLQKIREIAPWVQDVQFTAA